MLIIITAPLCLNLLNTAKEIAEDVVLFAYQIEPCYSSFSNFQYKIHAYLAPLSICIIILKINITINIIINYCKLNQDICASGKP